MPLQTKTTLTKPALSQGFFGPHTKFTYEKKKKRTKTAINAIFHFIFGFIFGCAKFPFGIYPCGTALVFASGENCFFSYLGACLSCALYPYGIGGAFAVNSVAFFSRAFFSSYRFDEKRNKKIAFSLILSAICGGITIISGGFEEKFILPAITYFISLPCLTFTLCTFLEYTKKSRISVDAKLCFVCFLVVFSLSQLKIPLFSPEMALSAVIILLSAGSDGTTEIFLALLCSVACGKSGVTLPLCAAAFSISCCDRRKKGICGFCFFCTFSALSLTFYGQNSTFLISGVLIGDLFYILLGEFLPKIFEKKQVFNTNFLPEKRQTDRLSKAFSSISDMVYTMSDKLKYPTETETRDEVRKICDSNCATCPMASGCYGRKLYDSLKVEDTICERLLSGGVKKSDLPEKYALHCIKLSEVVEKLNDGYSRMVFDRFRDNKTEILASEYSSMARLIKYTSQKEKTDMTSDPILEENARRALCAIGVRFSSVKAYGKREKIIEVSGVLIDKFPCTAKELSDYMSEKCGYLFSEPEYIVSGEKVTMRLKRARKIKLEYSRCACAKGGGGVNGDSVNFFESDDDFFYALISDGMGSGRSAALTSRLTSIFLEKLLTTGTHKNVTLEMLNNLLLSKSDESFATVDLLEVDLLSGDASFVKAGAAPAYIVRASKLYKIASFTPPAGIVRSFCAESTGFSLEKGDTVLMLSDGVVQSSDDAPWLCEMLSADAFCDPSRLCDKILSKARKINMREDDMTCAAVKVL